MRRAVSTTENELDRGAITPSKAEMPKYFLGDFTIIIRNLPPAEYDANVLKQFLIDWWRQQGQEKNLEIVKINIAYNILEYNDLCLKKN